VYRSVLRVARSFQYGDPTRLIRVCFYFFPPQTSSRNIYLYVYRKVYTRATSGRLFGRRHENVLRSRSKNVCSTRTVDNAYPLRRERDCTRKKPQISDRRPAKRCFRVNNYYSSLCKTYAFSSVFISFVLSFSLISIEMYINSRNLRVILARAHA